MNYTYTRIITGSTVRRTSSNNSSIYPVPRFSFDTGISMITFMTSIRTRNSTLSGRYTLSTFVLVTLLYWVISSYEISRIRYLTYLIYVTIFTIGMTYTVTRSTSGTSSTSSITSGSRISIYVISISSFQAMVLTITSLTSRVTSLDTNVSVSITSSTFILVTLVN